MGSIVEDRFLENRKVKGDTDGFIIDLNIGAALTEIYFDGYNNNINVPAGTQLGVLPKRPVNRIILINEGPGDFMYSTSSRDPDNRRATSLLRIDEDREIRVHDNTIRALYMLAVLNATNPVPTHAVMRVEITS